LTSEASNPGSYIGRVARSVGFAERVFRDNPEKGLAKVK